VDIKDHLLPGRPYAVNLTAEGAVERAGIDFFKFYKLLMCDLMQEFVLADEIIIHAVLLLSAGLPCTGGNGKSDPLRIPVQQMFYDRCFTRATWRREYN